MRRSQVVAILPNLEQAVKDIESDFERQEQASEFVKELEDQFERQRLLNEIATTTDARESELGQWESEGGFVQPKGKVTAHSFIENAYLWRHSATMAANDLRDCGWTKEAEKIVEVLNGLPTGPIDGNQPEILKHQRESIRTAAERVKKVLEACIKGAGAILQNATAVETPQDEQAEANRQGVVEVAAGKATGRRAAKSKSSGPKLKKLSPEEKKVVDLWKNGNGRFLTHNDLDEHLEQEFGYVRKTLDKIKARERRTVARSTNSTN